jgi:O-antigen ligase
MPFSRQPDRVCFVLYLLLLLAAPLPLGSNRPWAWEPLAMLIFALAIGWLVLHLRGRAPVNPVLGAARPMLICAGLFGAWVWLQLLPLPMWLLEWLSPQAAVLHAAAALGKPVGGVTFAPLTLDSYGGFTGALKTTAYMTFLALTLLLVHSRERLIAAAAAIVVSGLLQALIGGLGALGALGAAEAAARGTFFNRNHYAAYLVLCLSVGIGLLIGGLTGASGRSWRQFFRDLFQWIMSPKMLLRIALLVMVIALVLTRSRMGNLSFFIAMVITGLIGLALSRRATRSTVIVLASLVILDITVVGAYFGAERVIERIEQTSTETEDRDEVAGYALNLWQDYPLAGAGLGTFSAVFPRYSGEGTHAAYTHAHNDFIQFAAETGVIGFGLLGLMVLLSFVAALRAHYVRGDPAMRGASFAAMMGIIALMIHSAVDFSLQIPAVALTFMVLLAFAWLSLYLGRVGVMEKDDGDEAGDG